MPKVVLRVFSTSFIVSEEFDWFETDLGKIAKQFKEVRPANALVVARLKTEAIRPPILWGTNSIPLEVTLNRLAVRSNVS